MVTCSLDALRNSTKRKEMRIKKDIVEVLQQTIDSRKETGNSLTLHLLAKITLTLISSSAIIGCFQKANVQVISLVL